MERIGKLGTSLYEKLWMNAQIKAAPRKSYKDMKTLRSSFKGGLRLYYPINRDFYLSGSGVLLFVFLLFCINTFFPPAPSFHILIKGRFLTEMANASYPYSALKLIVGYAFIQLASMPLVFYAVRSTMEGYTYPGYFVSFKEKTLWRVYILLILFLPLFYVGFFLENKSFFDHRDLFYIFIIIPLLLNAVCKFLTQQIRGPRLNPSTGFNLSLNFILKIKFFSFLMVVFGFLIFLQTYVFSDQHFFFKTRQ